MFLYKVKIKKSKTLGVGAFTTEDIPRGALVAIFVNNVEIIPESIFNKSWLKKGKLSAFDKRVRRGGVRLANNSFLVPRNREDQTDNINHSNSPTLLYHCGLAFAPRDIKRSEELTCDYRFFDTEYSENFTDAGTGKPLSKKTIPKDQLKQTTKALLRLLD